MTNPDLFYKICLALQIALNFQSVLSDSDSLICPSPLMQKCQCGYMNYDRRYSYVIKCVDTRFRDTEVLEALPDNTEVVVFTGNNILQLPWNIFGTEMELKNLRVIDMSDNGIREILGKSYHHVSNVERLILNHNNISIAPFDQEGDHHHPRMFSNFINLLELHLTNAFEDNANDALTNNLHDIFIKSNLTLLNKLHLEQNEIRTFTDFNIFCDLPSLADLYLGQNLLSDICFNVTCLRKLRFLDLERNMFKTIAYQQLIGLDRLKMNRLPTASTELMMDISKNPLVCEKAFPLASWIQTTKVSVRNKNSLTCKSKQGNSGLTLNVTDTLSLRKLKRRQTFLAALYVTTFIAIISGLLASLYLIRKKLKFRGMLNTLSQKIHYTTIESQIDYV